MQVAKTTENGMDSQTPKWSRRLLLSVLFLLLIVWLSWGYEYFGKPLPKWLAANPLGVEVAEMLFSVLIFFTNIEILREGIGAIFHGKMKKESLGSMAAILSFIYSLKVLYEAMGGGGDVEVHFFSAGAIMTALSFEKMVVSFLFGQTGEWHRKIVNAAPKTGLILRNGVEMMVPVRRISAGERFVVAPTGKVPVDGVIEDGVVELDEQLITGSGETVEKGVGDIVLAGSIVKSGYITCKTIRSGEETVLSRKVAMVGGVLKQTSHAMKRTNTLENTCAWVIVALAILTFAVQLKISGNMYIAITHAISMLSVTTVGIMSTVMPMALLAGCSAALKRGILFRSARAIEKAGEIETMIFDREGTVSEGQAKLTDVLPQETVDVHRLMQTALMLEAQKKDPSARAITAFMEENRVEYYEPEFVEISSDNGITAVFDRDTYAAGSRSFIMKRLAGEKEQKALEIFYKILRIDHLERHGKSVVYYAQNGRLIGAVAVLDPLKNDIFRVIRDIKRMGLYTVLLTDADMRTAAAIGKETGFHEIIAMMGMKEKKAVIAETAGKKKVSFVGGSAAGELFESKVRLVIEMGLGANRTGRTADVVLMEEDAADLPIVIRLGKGVLRVERRILIFVIIYHLFALPLAAGVFDSVYDGMLLPAVAISAGVLCTIFAAFRTLSLRWMRVDEEGAFLKKNRKVKGNKVIVHAYE